MSSSSAKTHNRGENEKYNRTDPICFKEFMEISNVYNEFFDTLSKRFADSTRENIEKSEKGTGLRTILISVRGKYTIESPIIEGGKRGAIYSLAEREINYDQIDEYMSLYLDNFKIDAFVGGRFRILVEILVFLPVENQEEEIYSEVNKMFKKEDKDIEIQWKEDEPSIYSNLGRRLDIISMNELRGKNYTSEELKNWIYLKAATYQIPAEKL